MSHLRSSARAAAAVLMYHKVHASGEARPMSVRVDRFRDQMQALRRRGRPVVSLGELRHQLDEGAIVDGAVAITFDDGYADTAAVASETLVELSLPATFFIVTGPLGSGGMFWWDVLDLIFAARAPVPAVLELDTLDGPLRIETDGDRKAAHDRLRDLCYRLAADARRDLMAAVVRWAGNPTLCGDRPVNIEQLAALARVPGIEIAAHSRQHLWLPAQPVDVQRAEIEQSKREAETLLGHRVSGFSYPYGAWDASCAACVKEAGFAYAVTTEARPVSVVEHGYAIPRVAVDDLDGREFDAFLDRACDDAA